MLEFQNDLRDRMERQPIQFLVRDLEPMLFDSRPRGRSREFVGAGTDNVVISSRTRRQASIQFIRSLSFEPGDELLVTDHEYNACRNALRIRRLTDEAPK